MERQSDSLDAKNRSDLKRAGRTGNAGALARHERARTFLPAKIFAVECAARAVRARAPALPAVRSLYSRRSDFLGKACPLRQLLSYLVFRLGHSHQPLIKPADDVLQSLNAMPGLA